MPTFEQPAEFVNVRAEIPDMDIPLTISDMVTVLAEHLQIFLAHPEAFAGLPASPASALFGRIPVYQEAEKLAKSGATDWILVLPVSIQHTKVDDVADLGFTVVNSKAPARAHTRPFGTQAGRMLSRESCILERSMLVLVSLRSVPASFYAADAIYTWLASMLPVLKLEYGCRTVKLQPTRLVAEKERFLFEPVAGNPLAIGISAVTIPTFLYGEPDPA